jgi:hypothetical protein
MSQIMPRFLTWPTNWETIQLEERLEGEVWYGHKALKRPSSAGSGYHSFPYAQLHWFQLLMVICNFKILNRKFQK